MEYRILLGLVRQSSKVRVRWIWVWNSDIGSPNVIRVCWSLPFTRLSQICEQVVELDLNTVGTPGILAWFTKSMSVKVCVNITENDICVSTAQLRYHVALNTLIDLINQIIHFIPICELHV
jgi:hypothetical protein